MIDTAKVERVSVERAMSKEKDMPEIKELEDVSELEQGEVEAETVDETKPEKIVMPDVEAELDEEAEEEAEEEGALVPPRIPDYNNDKPATENKHKDIAEFEGEDEIVGMKS